MAFFRACDGARICLVLPRVTLAKVAFYAAQKNLDWDLAMNDLLMFGLDGEGIHLEPQAKPAPPPGEIWPKKPEGWWDCQECGKRYYADADYLCPDCREKEDDEQRRWNEQPYEIYP